MSSSGSNDFFDDTECESDGKGEGRGEAGRVISERNESNGDSTDGSSSEGDAAQRPEKDSNDQESDDNDNDDDNGASDEEDHDNSESIDEESHEKSDEGSGREGSRGHDGSEELERLFDASPAGITSAPPSPRPGDSRPTSARCRVRVVLESASGYRSSQKDLTGTRVKDQSSVSQECGGKDDHPPPLLVVKSPVYRRPAGKLGSSSPRSPRTPLSTNSHGLDRILSKKESAIAGRGIMGAGSGSTVPRLNIRRDNANKVQPRQRPLGKYTRSLKMLGVDVPPADPPPQRTGRSSSSQSWVGARKLHTRLTRRFTSLDDVTRAIPQVKTPEVLHTLHVDEGQRATLSQAVYEEWYFARRQQIQTRKVKAREQTRREEERKDMEKKAKDVKVNAAVSEWEKNKLEQKKSIREKKQKDAEKKMEEEKAKDEKNMQVSAALVAWETEKRELDGKRKEKMRLEKEAKREEERLKQASKEEAEMVYKMWKQKKMTELRERKIKEKEKGEVLAWKKEEEERRKREEADLAFNAWKRNKLKDERESTKKAIEASVQRSSAAKKREERSREALQAYEAWLDQVEEREPLRLYEDARAAAEVKARPPWWPGGSKNSLLQC